MTTTTASNLHLLDNDYGAHDMRQFYDAAGLIPTSHVADVALIRSHLAYHAGYSAGKTEIHASRGHSYRFDLDGERIVVRITDYYDHRNGVVGYVR